MNKMLFVLRVKASWSQLDLVHLQHIVFWGNGWTSHTRRGICGMSNAMLVGWVIRYRVWILVA